jgi:AcrR family transcriptional regulator
MFEDWSQFPNYVTQLESQGLVTRTFRRLDSERQKAVVQAILEESAQRGPHNLNVKNVAMRSGVPVGSLYQYFSDRQAMLDFAVRLCVDYMVGMFEMSRPYLAEMPLHESLTSYLSYGVAWSREQAWMLKLFARAAYQGDEQLSESLVRPVASAMRETTRQVLLAAQKRGEIRPDLDLEAAARAVNALLIAVADPVLMPQLNPYFQVTDGDEMHAERVFAAAVAMILNGVQDSGREGA